MSEKQVYSQVLTLSREEHLLLALFRKVDDEGRRYLLRVMQALVETSSAE